MLKSMKKTFWNEYIRASNKDHELMKERNSFEWNSDRFLEIDKLVTKNIQYCNSIGRALREVVKPKWKTYRFSISKIRVIGAFYRLIMRIFGSTYKNGGSLTIIGKMDRNGNVEYPNTAFYRLTKSLRWI